MAEQDKKRYYWIKLKQDFFQSYKMRALESMQNGMLYELIYLKLLTESITHNGNLRFSDTLPYNASILAGVINVDKDNLEKAVQVLKELELIEELDDGTLFMQEIEKLVGSETLGAERKREYRAVNQKADNNGTSVGQCPKDVGTSGGNSPQEIRDKSIELRDKSKDINIDVVMGVVTEQLQKYIPEPNAIWNEYIEYYLKQGISQELIIYAIKLCASNNLRSASYFNGICKNILQRGYKTVEEALYADDKMKKDKSNMKEKARQAYIDDIEMKKQKMQKMQEKEKQQESETKDDMTIDDCYKQALEVLEKDKPG